MSSRRSVPTCPFLCLGRRSLLFTGTSLSTAQMSCVCQAWCNGSPELFIPWLHSLSWAGRGNLVQLLCTNDGQSPIFGRPQCQTSEMFLRSLMLCWDVQPAVGKLLINTPPLLCSTPIPHPCAAVPWVARTGFTLPPPVPVPPGAHCQQWHCCCEVHALHPPLGLRDVPQ